MSEQHKSLAELFGVETAKEGDEGIAAVLRVLQDGEAHTAGSIDMVLQGEDVDLSGCQIAACLAYLYDVQGQPIELLGPYDSFSGAPERFKLQGPLPSLAAHAERLKALLHEHFHDFESDVPDFDEAEWHERVAVALDDAPQVSLALHNAEFAARLFAEAHEELCAGQQWSAAHHLLPVASKIKERLCRDAEADQ